MLTYVFGLFRIGELVVCQICCKTRSSPHHLAAGTAPADNPLHQPYPTSPLTPARSRIQTERPIGSQMHALACVHFASELLETFVVLGLGQISMWRRQPSNDGLRQLTKGRRNPLSKQLDGSFWRSWLGVPCYYRIGEGAPHGSSTPPHLYVPRSSHAIGISVDFYYCSPASRLPPKRTSRRTLNPCWRRNKSAPPTATPLQLGSCPSSSFFQLLPTAKVAFTTSSLPLQPQHLRSNVT